MHTSAFLLRCLVRLTQQATSPKTAASDTSWLTVLSPGQADLPVAAGAGVNPCLREFTVPTSNSREYDWKLGTRGGQLSWLLFDLAQRVSREKLLCRAKLSRDTRRERRATRHQRDRIDT